jgi:hypothetical protein
MRRFTGKGLESPAAKVAARHLTRRQFVVRSAAGLAGAAVSTYGYSWGDLAYGQQLAGKPVSFNVAIRPDWTQGWFGMINQEKQFWKKYLPASSEVTFSHPRADRRKEHDRPQW